MADAARMPTLTTTPLHRLSIVPSKHGIFIARRRCLALALEGDDCPMCSSASRALSRSWWYWTCFFSDNGNDAGDRCHRFASWWNQGRRWWVMILVDVLYWRWKEPIVQCAFRRVGSEFFGRVDLEGWQMLQECRRLPPRHFTDSQ